MNTDQLKTQNEQSKNLWNLQKIDFYELGTIQNGITALYDSSVNGYHIKSFLSNVEAETALERFSYLDSKAKGLFEQKEGYTIPKSFSMLANDSGINYDLLDDYFTAVNNYNKALDMLFPFGFQNRLFALFSNIENDIAIRSPHIFRQGQLNHFASSTIRVCFSEKGGIDFHVGNMFRYIYPAFYQYLYNLINVYEQMSYFVVLSKPERGGELVLYDASWQQFPNKVDGSKVISYNNKEVEIDSIDYQLVNPEPGDLFMFDGGNIWHRVMSPIGQKDRITIGGFFGKNEDGDSIYVWS